jgi:polyadenylate-binding protein
MPVMNATPVQNLEKDVTTRLLHDTFISLGPILSCKVALDKDLKSKGYGFVHFENPESAKAAIEQVRNHFAFLQTSCMS